MDDLNASQLNRRIGFQRFIETGDDEYGNVVGSWQDHGSLIFARRRDVSDQEKYANGLLHWNLKVRFVVRSSAFTRDISALDRVVHEGETFNITGIKEVPPGRLFIEITAETDPHA